MKEASSPSKKSYDSYTNTGTEADGKSVPLEEACGIEFGCGPCKIHRIRFPSFQYFATTRWALCFFSIGGFIQGFLVNGLTPSVLSTLERRFGLTSTESGFIASSYEIAAFACVLFVTYVGGRGHKPLWVAWGILLIGLAGVIFALPYFLAPQYTYIEKSIACHKNAINDDCQPSELRGYRFYFYLALFVSGAGSTPLYSLGVTFLDENVPQRYSAIYNGIFVMLAILGPGLGYVAGGLFLSIYTNLSEEVFITESNSQWVGAWWLGSLIFGIVGIFLSLPTFFLPKVIPGTQKYRVGRGKEVHVIDKGKANDDFGKKFEDFPKCVVILFRNPTYVFATLAATLDSLLIGGTAVFGPKFIEVQFGIDASTAGTYFGLLTILGGCGGQLCGGGLISKYDIKMKWMLHVSYLSPLLCVFFSFCFLLTCTDQPFAGVNQHYHNNSTDLNLYSSCNLNCYCSESDFYPVCGSDHVTYFSPCFAGCTGQERGSEYTGCSCLPLSDNITINQSAVEDVCIDEMCSSGWQLIVFCILIFGIMFFTFSNEAAALQVSLRCVAFNRRSFALGLQILMYRAFGTLPGPLLVGSLLDRVCVKWSNNCGERGFCLAYNNKDLALYLFLFIFLGKLVDVALYVCALLSYKPRLDKKVSIKISASKYGTLSTE